MEKIILSLKNIYRLLMSDDFPVYSDRVISKKQRKGQTLMRFWQEIMAPEFCSLPYGKMIWRSDGIRNRHISNLCNRNDELKYYHEYAKEVGTQITADSLLSQIGRFEDFLLSREYNENALRHRCKAFLRELREDDCITKSILIHMEKTLEAVEAGAEFDMEGNAFRMSYLFAVMTLYAAAGAAMNDPAMMVLRVENLSMEAVWNLRGKKRSHSSKEIQILTAYTGLLQDTPLSKDRFFGREAALFDLRDAVISGSKCLISGIGGMGKTELLRQLLRRCTDEHLTDKLALIPYSATLAESFGRSFPNLRQENQEDTLTYVLNRLEKEAREGRLLVLVDNVAEDAEADEELYRLSRLPCPVVVTSRRKELSGFSSYPVSEPDINACSLIFRDNYGSPLTDEDRKELLAILADPVYRHPLTLRLMAQAARSRNWSVRELSQALGRNERELSLVEDGRQIRVERVLNQLYPAGRIPQDSQNLVQLFTLLPYDSYDTDLLERYFSALFPDRNLLTAQLNRLSEEGLLDRDKQGFSMHPVIAQCLRRKTLPQSYLEPFLHGLCGALSYERVHQEDALEPSRLLLHMIQFLTGSIHANLLIPVLDAAAVLSPTKLRMRQYETMLKRLLRRCPDKEDTVEVLWHSILCKWNLDDPDAVQALFDAQKKSLTVPITRFLDFCLSINEQLLFSRPELAEAMLQTVLDAGQADPRQTASAYRSLSALAEFQGKSELSLEMAKACMEFIEQHPECGTMQTFRCMVAVVQSYLKFGEAAEAERLLPRMELMERKLSIPSVTLECLYCRGTYEMYFGDLAAAAKSMEKSLELHEDYYGRGLYYYSNLNQLAIIYQRMGKYEEAKSAYRDILNNSKDHVYFNVARNNYTVLLMDMGKPDEAMPYIEQVLRTAREQGGIALGEALRNKARAHGMLGEFSQERTCLEEACPLLLEAYGPNHPRPQAAQARLDQLKAEV